MPDTTNTISVVCSCGKTLKAPATSAGKKGRCPACGTVLVLQAKGAAASRSPAVAKTVTPKPVKADTYDNGFDALHDLAQQAGSAPAAAPAQLLCPACRAPMADRAVLCTRCGYDTRTGKSLNIATVPAGPKSANAAARQQPLDYMAPDGSLVMGIAFSAVAALVASIVWMAVAWLTGFAIGYIAILIGIAAGLGMQKGHGGYSKTGGMIAATMTILAIFVAKFIVLEIVLAEKGGNTSIVSLDSSKLAYYFFSPIGLIIIVIGVGAAYRTANGSSS